MFKANHRSVIKFRPLQLNIENKAKIITWDWIIIKLPIINQIIQTSISNVFDLNLFSMIDQTFFLKNEKKIKIWDNLFSLKTFKVNFYQKIYKKDVMIWENFILLTFSDCSTKMYKANGYQNQIFTGDVDPPSQISSLTYGEANNLKLATYNSENKKKKLQS